jgi:hypothetical protein
MTLLLFYLPVFVLIGIVGVAAFGTNRRNRIEAKELPAPTGHPYRGLQENSRTILIEDAEPHVPLKNQFPYVGRYATLKPKTAECSKCGIDPDDYTKTNHYCPMCESYTLRKVYSNNKCMCQECKSKDDWRHKPPATAVPGPGRKAPQ